MKNLLLLVSFIVLTTACHNSAHTTERKSPDSTKGSQSAGNVAEAELFNYWNGFDFNDTALVSSPQIGEQKLVNFIGMLSSVSDSAAAEAIQSMLKAAEVNETSWQYYIKKYAHYLYDPNSPMRSELYYEPVLAYLVKSPKTSDVDRIRYQTLLKLVARNQPGTTATDFSYIKSDGREHKLSEGAADYKMLLFYDPTCSHCAEVLTDLANSSDANSMIDRGKLEILAICPIADRKPWKDYQSKIPEKWINGLDAKGEVISKGWYNIQAYPTIFLLDKANKVVLKDAPLDVTLRYLLAKAKS